MAEQELSQPDALIFRLPNEMLWEITEHLAPISEARLTRTCKLLHGLLWKRFCRQQLSSSPSHRSNLLFTACRVGSTAMISVALEHHLPEINNLIHTFPERRRVGWHFPVHDAAPLHWATEHSRVEVVRMLLQHGAHVDVLKVGDREFTRLEVEDGREFTRLQVEEGREFTPLHLATDERCIALLLDAGASPFPRDEAGLPIKWIPLLCLLEAGHRGDDSCPPALAAVRLLLEATERADPTWSVNDYLGSQPTDCLSPLAMAIDQGPEFVRLVLEHGADANRPGRSEDPYNWPESISIPKSPWNGSARNFTAPPMQHAAFRCVPGALESMKILYSFGARPHEVHGGRTALLFAVASGKLETVRWLVEVAGLDPNGCAPKSEEEQAEDQRDVKWKPLAEAIKEYDVEMVKLLVGLGADARHPAAAAVLVTTLGLGHRCLDSLSSDELQDRGGQIAEFLVRSGADPCYSVPRAAYYISHARDPFRDGHRATGDQAEIDRIQERYIEAEELYYDQAVEQAALFANSGPGRQPTVFRVAYDPIQDQRLLVINSDGLFDADKERLAAMSREMACRSCQPSWRKGFAKSDFILHRYHRTWTMLHEVLVYNNQRCVERLFRHNIDPLCGMVHSSQMKNTPLGVLIRGRPGIDASEVPWTTDEWHKARFLLHRFGPSLTDKFPTSLMALFLAHAVAPLHRAEQQEARIREFVQLTGDRRRWGRDGLSDLRGLVRHPAYRHAFRKPAALCLEQREDDASRAPRYRPYICSHLALAHNMDRARRTIMNISKSPRRLESQRRTGRRDDPRRPRAKTQPMSEDDYEGFPWLYEKRKRTGTTVKRHMPKTPTIQSRPTPSNRFSVLLLDDDNADEC